MKVVVIGAGQTGSQIGVEFLLAGHEVLFIARRPGEAAARVDAALRLAGEFQLAPADTLTGAKAAVAVVSSVAEANGFVDLVIESIVEELEAKKQVLQAAARTFPGALLASNTSSLSITALGEASGAAERMLGIHYLSPPLLTRPVEVVVGARTARNAVERACAILNGLGKLPVVVERDVPGFVWNRLQFALLREALWLVGEGIASPETVDEVVKEGLARRWRYTGPFETLALGGVAQFRVIAANLFPELSTAQTVDDDALPAAKDEAMLAELRNRRDRGLGEELLRTRAVEPGA